MKAERPIDAPTTASELWDRVVEQLIQEIQHEASEKHPKLTAIVSSAGSVNAASAVHSL